jgi:hypothetical protein
VSFVTILRARFVAEISTPPTSGGRAMFRAKPIARFACHLGPRFNGACPTSPAADRQTTARSAADWRREKHNAAQAEYIARRRWLVTEAPEIPPGAFFSNDNRQMFINII